MNANYLLPLFHLIFFTGYITLEEFSEACQLLGKYMPNPMTQEQLVDICRLMDINKDGLVDLNEFLESFRLAEKSLQDEDDDEAATWHSPGRRPSRTAVDRDETGVTVEVLKLDDAKPTNNKPPKNGLAHLMGDSVPSVSKQMDEIELIDCDEPPRRPGLLESDM